MQKMTGRILKQNTFCFVALALSLFFASGLAPGLQNNLALGQGATDRGGGGAVNREAFATYLARKRLTGDRLRAFQNRVAPNMAELRERLPEFAAELERGFTDYNWYIVDRPLDQLPYSATRIPFRTSRLAQQDGPHVFFNQQELNALKPREDRPAIFQELLERIFFSGKNLNSKISHLNISLAADLLGKSPLPPAAELRAELNRLGFQTENLQRVSSSGSRELNAGNFLEIDLELTHPITLKEARIAATACMVRNDDPRSVFHQVVSAAFPEFISGIHPFRDTNFNSEFRQSITPEVLPTSTHTYRYASLDLATPANTNDVISVSWINQGSSIGIGISKIRNQALASGGTTANFVLRAELEFLPSFPQLIYQGRAVDSVLGELGSVNENRILESLSVRVDRANWQQGGMLSLRNRETNAIVANVSLNSSKFVDCLRERFQQAAARAAANTPAGANASGTDPKAAPIGSGAGARPETNGAQPGR